MVVSMLIPLALVTSAVLVITYIVGSELCLPAARHAVRTGNMDVWMSACFLVALGEWAIIAIGASFLLLAEHSWRLFAGAWIFRLVSLFAVGILACGVIWELAGRTRRNIARVLSRSLDLVLPPTGAQRELYTRERERLETGLRPDQEQVLRLLLLQNRTAGD
jgi:MFS family permease